jgi:hypothetical protein
MVCSYEEIIGPSCLLHRGKSNHRPKLSTAPWEVQLRLEFVYSCVGSPFITADKRLEVIKGLPVYEVEKKIIEKIEGVRIFV